MRTPMNPKLWQQLKSIRLSEVRKAISPSCYERSLLKGIFWYCFDMGIFLAGLAMVFLLQGTIYKLMGAAISGIATAMLFVWSHDAAHGTLFKSKRVAEVMGTIGMFPAWNIYRLWSFGHNKVHHGFTSLMPFDWIWRPLTPEQYAELSKFQRALYRIERNAFTCAFHYLRRVWWQEMLRFNPGKDDEGRRYYRNGKLAVLAYVLVMSVLSYFFAGGIIGVVCALVLPFIIFNYFIAMIVYLHHTHPDIPMFAEKREWSQTIGMLYCSTIIHSSRLWKMLLHNIMTHIPHHLDIRIPFYNLPKAYQELKKEYGQYIHEYRFSWSGVLKIFHQCKLYDFDKGRWMTYKEAKHFLAERIHNHGHKHKAA